MGEKAAARPLLSPVQRRLRGWPGSREEDALEQGWALGTRESGAPPPVIADG